ncbi:class E sortase [Sediminivirga luteola]|uniref:class E sortase n=1 Tax=Sediminivirga luteola TaxID=1774748 RepID=UPI001F563745|nr:class E sortase [Sediminivirga luteola]MCI2267103.1 class E sortase [Sediminivirga luteola]
MNVPSDQPLTRRERRERERAAEQAAAARQAGGQGQSRAQDGPAGPAPAYGSAAAPGVPGNGGANGTRRPLVKPAAREGSTAQHGAASGSAGPYAASGPATEPMRFSAEPGPDTAPVRRTSERAPAPAAAGGSGTGNGGKNRGKKGAAAAPQRQPLGPVRATVRTFGELCITAGLVLILFVVWQLWWTDIDANRDNRQLAQELTQEWDRDADRPPADPDTPFVAEPVAENSAFGLMYVPRFGDDYFRTIAEGVSMEPVLNRMGVGRYPTSAMPGEVGNFAVAGHRVTYGKPLNLIAELRPGDEIVVQTADGFYTYTFRNFDIVLPDEVEVLAPVPGMPDYQGKDRIMTLTACNPMFSARERYIAYAELTDWRPAEDGPPESIADSAAYAENHGEG